MVESAGGQLPKIAVVLVALIGGPAWFLLVWLYISERPPGEWQSASYVYSEPVLVFSTQATPADDGRVYPIEVSDADERAFVRFKIEYDGGLGKAEFVIHELNQLGWKSINRETTYGVRLGPNKTTKLVIHMPERSDPTIVRAYMLSWEKP